MMRPTIHIAVQVITSVAFVAAWHPANAENDLVWELTRWLPASEAYQAAAADEHFVYAITNRSIAKYDRVTGNRISGSKGDALHLNSGFILRGKLYAAHSNYPQRPELSQIKVLDLASMRLTTLKDFGDFGGSLTWVVRNDGHWWCNFARYGGENRETFLVELDDDWQEQGRWTYPPEVIRRLGRYSLSGGLWKDDTLLVTGHDDPVVFRLAVPKVGDVLTFIDEQKVPFTGQGIAHDPVTDGLVGISRAKRRLLFAVAPRPSQRPAVEKEN